ncbi:hypothetical protein K432DRAFT_281156, partial [Lepidopterella palustris CBS 459.81]
YNLLNLKEILENNRPKFLQERRFQLIHSVSSRAIARKFGGDLAAGKPHTDKLPEPVKHTARECYVGFHSYGSFNLFAQRGAVSGSHVDWLNGTWARCVTGLKAWPVMTDLSSEEMETYKKERKDGGGDMYLPTKGRFKMVVLEPQDTLIMPPGTIVVHAPITVEDSLMDGGMFWDEKNLLPTLRNILDVARNPSISNEIVPRQFAEVMDELEAWVKKDTQRFADAAE